MQRKNRSGRWTVPPTGHKKGGGIQGISAASAARAKTLSGALGTRLDLLKQTKAFKDGSTKVERTVRVYTNYGETEAEFYFHTALKKYKGMLEFYQLRIIKRQTL